MAAGQEKRVAIADVWAESLMGIAAGAGREDELHDELQGLVAVLDRDRDLETLLASPLADQEEKRRLLERALRGRASDLLVDALQVMRRKGRLDLVRDVARAYHAAWLERRNRVEVTVASAVPLSDSLRGALAAAVARRSGQEPILVERVEPDLLGGLVVRIGDEKFDASVARELDRVGEALLARASRELIAGTSYVTDVPSDTPQGEGSR